MDLTDPDERRAVLGRLGAPARSLLILTEGFLVYLTPEQVGALARDLRSIRQCRWWLTDLVSPTALPLMQSILTEPADARDVKFLFAPAEGPGYFRRYGWEADRVLRCFDEGRRLRRRFLAKEVWSADLSAEQREALRSVFAVVKLRAR
jgi:hypothetical protein